MQRGPRSVPGTCRSAWPRKSFRAAAFAAGLAGVALPAGAAVYHVSANGNDAGDGSPERPFRTIQRAASLAAAGDTGLVHAGVYRETVRPAHSGEAGTPIRFVAATGETVVVSGADLVHWTAWSGRVLRAAADWPVDQVFVDGAAMTPARFPNAGTRRWQIPVAEMTPESNRLVCAEFTQPAGFWRGGKVWGLSARLGWVAGMAEITDSESGAVRTASVKPPWFGGGTGRGFLCGVLGALDSEREWHQQDGVLYLWPPSIEREGAGSIEVSRRRWAFDLSERRFIEVHGFRLFAAAVNMDGASGCALTACRVRWPCVQRDLRGGFNRDRGISLKAEGLGLVLAGRRNAIRDTVVAFSTGDGVSVYGESNTVENCVIHDCNTSASDCAPITCTGVGHVIRRCTLFNGGRSILVHRHLKAGRIEHNHMFNAGLLSNDLGMTYTYQTESQGTTIAYNRIHHNLGRAPGNVGIYLDDMSRNHVVRHNVVYGVSEAMALNPPSSTGNLVLNNTLDGFNVSIGMSQRRTQDMRGTRLVNNIFLNRLPSVLPNAEIGTNWFPGADARFEDREAANYQLRADSPAVDAGVPVPPYTDGFAGRAPDLGAFERGQPPWTAGSAIPRAEWDEDPEWNVPAGHQGPCYDKATASGRP